jgi:hypothetical protein
MIRRLATNHDRTPFLLSISNPFTSNQQNHQQQANSHLGGASAGKHPARFGLGWCDVRLN